MVLDRADPTFCVDSNLTSPFGPGDARTNDGRMAQCKEPAVLVMSVTGDLSIFWSGGRRQINDVEQ